VPAALYCAAAAGLAGIPLVRRWKLQTGAGLDLTPSMQWPEPIAARTIDPDRGPVLVTIEYRIDPRDRDRFLRALKPYALLLRRDGAYDFGIFEDPAEEGRFVETFMTDSWIEHLRLHRRLTNADHEIERTVRQFQKDGEPRTRHLIFARPHEENGT
jgi:hypothetical protein